MSRKDEDFSENLKILIRYIKSSNSYKAEHFYNYWKHRGLLNDITVDWIILEPEVKMYILEFIAEDEDKIQIWSKQNPDKIKNESELIQEKFQQAQIKENLKKTSEHIKKTIPSIDFSKDLFEHTPLLSYYSQDTSLKDTFRGKFLLIIMHFLRDLIPFVEALKSLGLEMKKSYFFYKDYPYTIKDEIIEYLIQQEAIVDDYNNLEVHLDNLQNSEILNEDEIIIIEDGGFIVPMIHNKYVNLIPNVIGAVEQTTRGIFNAKTWEESKAGNKLKFPLISVATCDFKTEFEPRYIADAVINNLNKMVSHIGFGGMKVAVLGFGTIGRKVAKRLKMLGVNVEIYDPKPTRMLRAAIKGYKVYDLASQACKNKDFVIGASGYNAIESDVIRNLDFNSYIVSTSSEQYEIDLNELNRLKRDSEPLMNSETNERIGTIYYLAPDKRKINVIADGYPINFWHSESMPKQASDVILSLLLLCAIELTKKKALKPGINREIADKIAEEHKLARNFLTLWKMQN